MAVRRDFFMVKLRLNSLLNGRHSRGKKTKKGDENMKESSVRELEEIFGTLKHKKNLITTLNGDDKDNNNNNHLMPATLSKPYIITKKNKHVTFEKDLNATSSPSSSDLHHNHRHQKTENNNHNNNNNYNNNSTTTTHKVTEDGLKIYTLDELNIGKGGGTKDCPFDCNCCF